MKTHIFGELDLDLSKSFDEIYKKIFYISECCGYMPDHNKQKTLITVSGSDNCVAKIEFKNNKVFKVTRMQHSDDLDIIVDWHEVKIGSYISIYEV